MRPDDRKAMGYALKAAFLGPQSALGQQGLSLVPIGPTLGMEANREVLRLDPLYLYAVIGIGDSLHRLSRCTEALAAVDEALAIEPDSDMILNDKVLVLTDLGRWREAAGVLEKSRRLAVPGSLIASALLGLEYAIEYDQLMLDPRLEPLRQDARFKPILEESRQKFQVILEVMQQARMRNELPRYLEAPIVELVNKLGLKLPSGR